jgi:hypothetical protein
MILLHAIRNHNVPHPEVPILSSFVWDLADVAEEGNIPGRLFDMWIEDGSVVGLWAENETDDRYIINLRSDYEDHDNRWLGEDLAYIRQAFDDGSPYYVYDYNILQARGTIVEHIITTEI